jgi:hypothetical protein
MTADESRWRELEQGAPDTYVPDTSPRVDIRSADGVVHDTTRRDAAPLDSIPRDRDPPDLPPPDLPPPDLPPPDSMCPHMVLGVAAASDDGEIGTSGHFVDGEANYRIFMGYWGGGPEWGYFRFALSQPIPKGAKIVKATLALFGETAVGWDGASHALEVFAEQSADAATVASAADAPMIAGGRPVTSKPVRWPASGGLGWSLGGYNTIQTLAPLVQEVVDAQGGLAAASHIQLWLRGSQTADADISTSDLKAPGYVAHPATLSIDWCH